MKKTNTLWSGFLIFLLILAVLCLLIFLLFRHSGDQFHLILAISWFALFSIAIWLGQALISRSLNQVLPWKKYVSIRLLTQLFLSLLYALVCLNASYFLLKYFFTTNPPILEQIITMNIYGTIMVLPTFFLFYSIHFLRAWRKSELESERLQKENVRSQMMALKNHLDPHFLFNNLNILSSLMETDIELSQAYLSKFAEVYRIILRTEMSDLISVEEELRFIEAYVFLLKIRFGEGLDFQADISLDDQQKAIPPLGIQMLVENAMKHNKVSKNSPLKIRISSSDSNYLRVENNLQPKVVNGNKLEGSGLQNIRNRYGFFTDKTVQVEIDAKRFAVEIPLLEIESF